MKVKELILWETEDGTLLTEEPRYFFGFQCGECDKLYEDLDEAKECCKE